MSRQYGRRSAPASQEWPRKVVVSERGRATLDAVMQLGIETNVRTTSDGLTHWELWPFSPAHLEALKPICKAAYQDKTINRYRTLAVPEQDWNTTMITAERERS